MADEESIIQIQQQADPISQGLLQILAGQQTTTPEAQDEARKILTRYEDLATGTGEEETLQKLRDTAAASRQALVDARKELLGRKRDDSGQWFRLAAALASPTRTGAFGESLGKAAGVLGEEAEKKSAWEEAQRKELMGLESQMSRMDREALLQELTSRQATRKTEAGLAGKALGVLGKRTPTKQAEQKALRKTQSDIDRKYIPEFHEWQKTGATMAAKNIAELTGAVDMLERADNLSGPIIGLGSLEWVPKQLKDLVFPASTSVQEVIEGIAQRSLKDILGAQFAAREGEMLLQRVFNPALEEDENRRRAFRLLKQIEEAAKERGRKAAYFEKEGTLAGFEGKMDLQMIDFIPPDELMEITMPTKEVIKVPKDFSPNMIKLLYTEQTGKPWNEEWNKLTKGYQAGGPVESEFRLGDPRPGEEEDTGLDWLKDLAGVAAGGAGAGYLTGKVAKPGARGIMHLYEKLSGKGPEKEEKHLLRALSVGDEEDAFQRATQEVIQNRRRQVPSSLRETVGPSTRELARKALTEGGPEAQRITSEMEERHEGSRERVQHQLSEHVKPDDYFEELDELTEGLYQNAKPLYESAYEAHPGISLKEVPALEKIMQSPDGKRAVKVALRLMQNEGEEIGKADAVGMVRKPSLKFLDYVKRGFDQIIRKEEDKGPTTLGRSMRGLRTKLRDQLDAISPEYGEARAQYAGDLEVLDALQRGRKEFRRIPVDDLKRAAKDMSKAEIQAYKTGAYQNLAEMIDQPASDANMAQRLVGSPAMREKLMLIIKNPSERRLLMKALRAESQLFKEEKKMLSEVERGQAREYKKEVELGTARGVKGKAARTLHQRRGPLLGLIDFLSDPNVRLEKEMADNINKILDTKDPKKLKEMGERLSEFSNRRKRVKARTSKAGRYGAGIGAALGAGAVAKEKFGKLLEDEEEE